MPIYDNASRGDLRKVYLEAWRKHKEGLPLEPLEAQVVTVIGEHPEYHPLFDDPESALATDFSPESGRENPFLHMAVHLAIRDQVTTDRPPGIRDVYNVLARRRGQLAAEHSIGEHLTEMMWQSGRGAAPPSVDVYLRRVKKLIRP